MPKPINLERLRSLGACKGQLAAFEALFGQEDAPLSVETAVAHAQTFEWEWAACQFLPAPARKAYDEAVAPARKAYDEAVAPARKAYDEAIASAQKAYNEVRASARKAYDEAHAPAWKAYKEDTARAFAEAYLSQED